MSGKPYTMKEMKGIVDYLTEHKYYTVIKGRKMWMDYANTSLTNRTWQSLKETFIKRILPDISNPYYKLTKEQIVSFKQGYDVEAKERNKLEIQTISDDSDGQQQKDKQESTSNIKEESTVKDNKSPKIVNENRSSTDTVVLENCYDNAEEIQKVLESSASPDIIEKKQKRPIRKFKDYITYSEPLAPILQEVINDFASDTESSDREPVMEIDLNAPDTHNEDNVNQKQTSQRNKNVVEPLTVETSEDVATNVIDEAVLSKDCEVQPKDKITTKISQNEDLNKIVPVTAVGNSLAKLNEGNENADDNSPSNPTVNSNTESGNKDDTQENIKKITSQNCSNTTDSLLPNNPEGFQMNKTTQIESNNRLGNSEDNSLKLRSSRKRATSEDNLLFDTKKKKIIKKVGRKENLLTGKNNKSTIENIMESHEEHNNTKETNLNFPTTSKSFIEAKKQDVKLKSPVEEKLENNSPQVNNLCLKSVSLFEEQFNNNQYLDSESSGVDVSPKEVKSKTTPVNKQNKVPNDNIVLLKSNSRSESLEVNPKSKVLEVNRSATVHNPTKSQRDDALANVFGFSTGAVTSSRKTKLNRKRSISQRKIINAVDSDSSEWTSQTESDTYISPPRGRRNRQMKKYLKPKSARILSLEEEGGLFVMYGKRIYPIVKDGKLVKNYVTYTPNNNDSDFEDETFWKLKYEEERKKSEELKKLLNQNQENTVLRDKISPRQETNSSGVTTNNCRLSEATTQIAANNNVHHERNTAQNEPRTEDKIKIKFSRNNEEVHLEGNWPQINTVLEQVVNMFHKEVPPKLEESKPVPSIVSPSPLEISSGKSTPLVLAVDPEVRRKTLNIEKEIFQEIEERDKEDQTKPHEEESNVTKRPLRRSSRISTASVQNAVKRNKSSSKQTEPSKPDEIKVENENRTEDPVNTTYVVQTRARGKTKEASIKSTESKPKQTRKSTPLKKQQNQPVDDDEKIRYMLPPAKRESSNKKINTKNIPKTSGSYTKEPAGVTSPDSLSRISESTQGYHESDNSPVKLRKKKKLFTILRRSNRRRSHALLSTLRYPTLYNLYDNSSSSLSRSKTNSTQQYSSSIYNSESYQNLFPHRVPPSNFLERIDEICTIDRDIRSQRFDVVFNKENIPHTKNNDNDMGSSSNVSLPLSPELSLVETMSINKDLLSSANGLHTMNGVHCANDMDKQSQFKYTISEMDITVPLMQQMCAIDTNETNNMVTSSNKNTQPAVTESLLNEIGSVKIYDNSSDSIDRRLENLLLESTKKCKVVENMEVDSAIVSNTKKSGAKKRSSTPRKKKEPNQYQAKKYKNPKADVIIEEHRESCSFVGGTSCPPTIQLFDENAMECVNVLPDNNVKRKQKKDIIKVKILKPKPNKSKHNCELYVQSDNRMSVCTDSRINDTEMACFPIDFDNSVELIHNHSETCLHANECIGDSVELIENNRTVISLNSNSVRSDDWQEDDFFRIDNNTQLINNNVPNFQVFNNQLKSNNNKQNGNEIIHQSANDGEANSSLITEDLSDETPTQTVLKNKETKWFLLSDDEVSNTNIACPQVTGTGSNLKQIFPITCAIPDLSDITEASKENDEGKKSYIDVDLQSIFGTDWI